MRNLVAIFFVLFSLTISLAAFGDTPAPGTVKAKLFSGDGNTSLGATGTSLNVNVTNPGGGTQTVNQGTAGASAWPVSLASQPLPTGAATETSLLGVNTNLTSILAKMPTLVSGNMPVAIQNASLAVTGTFWQATQPVSGTFWQATQPVSIATMPTTPVTGTFWQATQPVSGSLGRSWTLSSGTDSVAISGTVTATNSANGATAAAAPAQATQVGGSDGTNLRAIKVSSTGVVSVDGSATTQPISASALPLPSGAATSALQTTGNTSLSSIDTKTPALVTGRVPVDGSGVTQPISASALPLPSGAATSALQTTGNSSLTSIDGKTPALGQALAAASVPVVLPATQITALTPPTTVTVTQATGTNLHAVIDSGAVTATISGTPNVAVTSSALPTGAATSANQSTEISSLSTIATNTTNAGTPTVIQGAGGASAWKVDGSAVTQPVSGTFWQATQPVSAASLPLPTGAATQTTLASIDTKTAPLGQTVSASSSPVVIASDQSTIPVMATDSFVTGQSAQTALVNNILTATAGTAASDLLGYKSALVQIVSTGTAGAFIFEGSNDNTNFQTIPVYSQLITTGTPIVAAITPTASQLGYVFPIQFRYIRVRISTAITGGSIQAFSRFSQNAFAPAVLQVAQNTAASLQSTVTGTVNVGTVTSITSDQLAIPGIIADVASAAITTTTTTATLTPTFGVGYKVTIPVTVVSGTTPTMVVQVQESGDTGTNWSTVYTFPTISATGYYESPPLFFKGNRVRYVQTIAGTTPSFTRAINRLQMSAVAAAPVNNNATFASAAVSAVTTLTAPANAVGFILQNLNTNTTSLRYAIGATASSTNGLQLEPGRDSGEVHAGQNISICPESGTITYSIQWIQQ